jgi:hypothetical protein
VAIRYTARITVVPVSSRHRIPVIATLRQVDAAPAGAGRSQRRSRLLRIIDLSCHLADAAKLVIDCQVVLTGHAMG